MSLADWGPRPRPGGIILEGSTVRLEPLDWARHGADLASAFAGPSGAAVWRYMPMGPFENRVSLERGFGAIVEQGQWVPLAITRKADGKTLGMSTYMRIREQHGSAEIGAVAFSSELKRTRMATEAMYMLARHIFEDLGYRRYEWKCHNENTASKRAAERFGFTFEGLFRNDMVVKGANRDTAWYAMTDDDWPRIKAMFEAWLSPDNFDGDGTQRRPLSDFRG